MTRPEQRSVATALIQLGARSLPADETDSGRPRIRRNMLTMPMTAESGTKPLRVARRVVREIGQLLDEGRGLPNALTVEMAPDLFDELRANGDLSTFARELSDIVTSMTGLSTRIDLAPEGRSLAEPLACSSPLASTHTTEVPRTVSESDRSKSPMPIAPEVPWFLAEGDRRHPVRDVTVIGRSSSCDLVLKDSEASRRHAEVRRDDQGLRVRDLGSTNGTRVNDTVIADWTTLSAGDVVSIGTTTITVVDK